MAEFTPEQQRLLNDEEFLREVISKRYFSTPPPSRDSAKPAWQRFLESTGGAALITVVLGGIFGNIIAQSVQSWNKQRETQLAAFQEYIKGEEQTAKDAFQLIGKCIAASENLSTLTESEFDLAQYESATEREAVRRQKADLRNQYNKADDDWRSNRETIALMMAYYHHNKPEVSKAWRGAQDGLTNYMDCEKRWYLDHDGAGFDMKTAQNACSQEKGTLYAALQALTSSLEAARVYEWELSKQK